MNLVKVALMKLELYRVIKLSVALIARFQVFMRPLLMLVAIQERWKSFLTEFAAKCRGRTRSDLMGRLIWVLVCYFVPIFMDNILKDET